MKNKCNWILLISLILAVSIFLTLFLLRQQNSYQNKQALQQVWSIIDQTQYNAAWAKKLNGQEVPAWGLYFDFEKKQLLEFADLNDNLIYDEQEKTNVFEQLDWDLFELNINENMTIVFKNRQFIDNVCINEDCQILQDKTILQTNQLQLKYKSQIQKFVIE